MASQVATNSAFIEINSFVRGVHAYKDIWHPTVGEVLPLRRKSIQLNGHSDGVCCQ